VVLVRSEESRLQIGLRHGRVTVDRAALDLGGDAPERAVGGGCVGRVRELCSLEEPVAGEVELVGVDVVWVEGLALLVELGVVGAEEEEGLADGEGGYYLHFADEVESVVEAHELVGLGGVGEKEGPAVGLADAAVVKGGTTQVFCCLPGVALAD